VVEPWLCGLVEPLTVPCVLLWVPIEPCVLASVVVWPCADALPAFEVLLVPAVALPCAPFAPAAVPCVPEMEPDCVVPVSLPAVRVLLLLELQANSTAAASANT
jgi:hypothetical protein